VSSAPNMRRGDLEMTNEQARKMLELGYAGRLATYGMDGYPYCVPLLYVWAEHQVFVHGTNAASHFQANIRHEPRVCFELDEPGEVFDYGRFECDSGLSFRSLILFGTMRLTEDRAAKQLFCERLMEKYGKANSIRPKNFFPRLDIINVYAMTISRMTGKEKALPDLCEQWPNKDRTRTPDARPEAFHRDVTRSETGQ
jgi:uncharacterized protein